MRTTLALLIGVAALLATVEAAERSLAARAVHNVLLSKLNVKRQDTTTDNADCVDEKVKARLGPDSECYQRSLDADTLLGGSLLLGGVLQDALNPVFTLLCQPECGKIYLEAERACGTFDEMPGLQDLFIGFCATDSDGEYCYQHFSEFFNFYFNQTGFDCLFNSLLSRRCECQLSDLEQIVQQSGCCLNIFNDYFTGAGDAEVTVDLTDVFTDTCGVSVPGDCNNSPLGTRSSSSQVRVEVAVWTVTMAALLAAAFH